MNREAETERTATQALLLVKTRRMMKVSRERAMSRAPHKPNGRSMKTEKGTSLVVDQIRQGRKEKAKRLRNKQGRKRTQTYYILLSFLFSTSVCIALSKPVLCLSISLSLSSFLVSALYFIQLLESTCLGFACEQRTVTV